ncbi:MAG TPA: hypothetical protein VM735_01220, partial [Candidatus Kapabacteria bacterium]|nr:hypothetical protein [Candidatus Kapabacteria bacterium]
MLDSIAGIYLLCTIVFALIACSRFVGLLAGRRLIRPDWQIRALTVACLMACLLVGVVEVTSLVSAISAVGLGTAWLIVAAILFKGATRFGQGSIENSNSAKGPKIEILGPEPRIVLLVSGVIAFISFTLAILTPPTSWDSLTYHLPRVLNWIQNETVAHFATHDTRQVESGPFAAFAVMQLFLVTQSDRLVNLVQWIAMVLSVIGVSWLTTEILSRCRGSNRDESSTSTAWTVLFAVTMPVGIVQSITTQTDYVVALWVVSAAVFGMLFWTDPANPLYAFFLGASVALGTLTKATMVVTAGVLCVFLVVMALRRASSNAVRIKAIAILAVTGILVVGPHFSRNLRVFGSPLGSQYIYALMRNAHQSPSIWISNFVRNLSLHSASGIPQLTSGVNSLLKSLHKISGRDENDRATTFFTSTFSYVNGYPMSDNSAGNFWHALLALTGAGYLAFRHPIFRRWVGVTFAIVLVTFAIQNGYLRWTEWNARFHLPLFLLITPIAGIALAQFPLAVRVMCGLTLAIVGFHASLYNKSRPILGENDFLFQERERQYFLEVPYLYRPSINAITDIIASGSTNVGIRLYKNFFEYQDEMEYPFWAMMRNRGFHGKVYNIGMTNETARLSNSVPIQALMSSAKGPRSDVAHVLPYTLRYPPLDVYWAESSSRWLQLAQLDTNGSERLLSENPNALELTNNAAAVACRAARQGVLTVEAALVRNDALVPAPTTLLVKTYAGFASISQSTNARHSFDIPLPPGITAVEFGIPGEPDPRLNIPLQWSWKPTEGPLPYVFVSRIYDPAAERGITTNATEILAGGSRAIQMVAGSAGNVDLRFFTSNQNLQGLVLKAQDKTSQINFTNGIGVAQLEVHQGTNLCTITNQTSAIVAIDRIDPTFRSV